MIGANGWPMIGQRLVNDWPMIGAKDWPLIGKLTGKLLANGWPMICQWLANKNIFVCIKNVVCNFDIVNNLINT
jgi:hypothetical protein